MREKWDPKPELHLRKWPGLRGVDECERTKCTVIALTPFLLEPNSAIHFVAVPKPEISDQMMLNKSECETKKLK